MTPTRSVRTYMAISLSVLGLALLSGTTGMAATSKPDKHKTELRSGTIAKSSKASKKTAKASQKSKATSKTRKTTRIASSLSNKKTSVKDAPEAVLARAKPEVPAAPIIMNAAPLPYHLVAGQGTPIKPVPLRNTLSADDAGLYKSALELIDKGDYDGADARLMQVKDTSLLGYAQYHKLFSRNYNSTYEELMAWLNTYGDQPMAMKVWGLAKRKKPAGADDPDFPHLARTTGAGVQLSALSTLSGSTSVKNNDETAPANDTALTPKSARSAYNNGDMEQAVRLGRQIGDHWVAGLANWRLKRYDQALAEFKFVSSDPSTNAWTQSSGAYWAARCAMKLNRDDDAETFLQLAASFPFTFYGLVAEARLGVTPAIALAKKGLPPTFSRDQRSALSASLTSDFSWTQNQPQAERLNALVQIGLTADAKDELQAAIQQAPNKAERDRWLAFAAKTHVPINQLKPTDRLFDTTLYPLPDFAPDGGFTIDRALVFAIARKESKFNPKAYSYSGAYGLLQLMPATAALTENNSSFTKNPKQLLRPEVNLRVGQNYINRLQATSIVDGDLLRTIAAYNAGPRPVKDATDSLGSDADSLLVMESIPVAQTRQYVEEVAANYWIYRQIMGKPSKTLAMAANDARIIDLSADSPGADD
ncbi:MAG: transglycosylase SLT domain-containing protein [Asticcacaulis sp.]